MLLLNQMAFRRKSKETAPFEAIVGGAGLGFLLFLVSPQFRLFMVIMLALLLIVSAALLGIWLAWKAISPEKSESAFKAEVFTPDLAGDRSSNIPPVINAESRYARRVPKLTISEKLRKIDWFQFEKLIELIYLHRGYTVKRLCCASVGNAGLGFELTHICR